MTRLSGVPTAEAKMRAEAMLEKVRLPLAKGGATKPIRAYSKGMRQKVKLAQALAHNPTVLILDEPLTGTDPVSRHQISELCRELGKEGKTVIISSHVLHEVERVTEDFVLVERGRLLAQGNVYQIRDLIDRHPHRIDIRCSDARALAALLVANADVAGVQLTDATDLTVHTPKPDACYDAIPRLALNAGIELRKMSSPDNNLEAVFRYLTR
jgi:ABC-2 type transport system ATP-binding protein